MGLSIISFTKQGMVLSEKLAEKLKDTEYAVYTKCKDFPSEKQTVQWIQCSVEEWTKKQFEENNAIVFIGACGIAVRSIAPNLTDKLQDCPVLVMDEKGAYVIPILSGHIGGANELACFLASHIDAIPIITTATDIQQVFAVDLFAKKNSLTIVNKEGIAKVSAKVLAKKEICISIEKGHLEKNSILPKGVALMEYPPLQRADVVVTSEEKRFDADLLLHPKEYVIGIGCRKGKEAETIESFLKKILQNAGIGCEQIYGMASIDRKKEEPGLLNWSRKKRIMFHTYTAEELNCMKGNFHTSAFVKEQVGVDNVCERAALKMCGENGRLVYEKQAEDGMTIAIARREWRVSFGEK